MLCKRRFLQRKVHATPLQQHQHHNCSCQKGPMKVNMAVPNMRLSMQPHGVTALEFSKEGGGKVGVGPPVPWASCGFSPAGHVAAGCLIACLG